MKKLENQKVKKNPAENKNCFVCPQLQTKELVIVSYAYIGNIICLT